MENDDLRQQIHRESLEIVNSGPPDFTWIDPDRITPRMMSNINRRTDNHERAVRRAIRDTLGPLLEALDAALELASLNPPCEGTRARAHYDEEMARLRGILEGKEVGDGEA